MPLFRQLKSRPLSALKRRNAEWVRDNRGAAAVEFAIVALPFLLLVMGIIGVGLYFFTNSALQHGVESAARQIRTGQAQKDLLTIGQFRELVCTESGSYIDCNKLRVHLAHGARWIDIQPVSCADDQGDLHSSTGEADDYVSEYSGEASQIVLVTLCYQWDLAEIFSFLHLGHGANGTGPAILQSATAFRTEPYS